MSDAGIVVTGLGALSALGRGVGALADGLKAGRSGIVRSERLGLAAGELGAFALGTALQALPACPAPLREKARRAALRAPLPVETSVFAAVEAWLDAGLHSAELPPERLGLVVAGSNLSQRYQFEMAAKLAADGPEFLDPRYATRFLDTDHVGVVSEVLGIRGEGFTVGGASASGNVAILKAWQLLRLGDVDACVVVAPVADLSPLELHALRNVGALGGAGDVKPEEACRPFDRQRGGFILGQGAAALVLERRDSARRRGATVHATLAGASLVLSASHLPSPDVAGEAAAMRRALAQAGVPPEAVDYVNAHATASAAGDEVEVQALREVFGGHVAGMWINSTKGLTGHCLYAAGVLECVATVVQMKQGFVHPSANLHEPIDAECRFCGRESAPARIGVALSNAFGFGGINTSVVLRAE
uniref:Ketosynthase n=1 Tax=Pyxidicoccus sp. MCy9557 TaxID=2012863 RepID=A0A1Z2TJM6_9BACT|nr:ketosynthase [Pyxidicoccus sp. MCy9557]